MDDIDKALWDAMHVCKEEIILLKANVKWIRYLLYVAILLGLVRLPFEIWGPL